MDGKTLIFGLSHIHKGIYPDGRRLRDMPGLITVARMMKMMITTGMPNPFLKDAGTRPGRDYCSLAGIC
jgi:hypothetical protein